MREITTAASSERTRGRHEAIGPLSINASYFFDTVVVKTDVTALTLRLFRVITLEP